MDWSNVRWFDANKTLILAERDGVTYSIPADASNTDFASLAKITIEALAAPAAPTEAGARAEAHRRVALAVGATDTAMAGLIIADNARERQVLLAAEQTEQTAARLAELALYDTAIERIWTGYNAMSVPPPSDYQDDKYWQ